MFTILAALVLGCAIFTNGHLEPNGDLGPENTGLYQQNYYVYAKDDVYGSESDEEDSSSIESDGIRSFVDWLLSSRRGSSKKHTAWLPAMLPGHYPKRRPDRRCHCPPPPGPPRPGPPRPGPPPPRPDPPKPSLTPQPTRATATPSSPPPAPQPTTPPSPPKPIEQHHNIILYL